MLAALALCAALAAPHVAAECPVYQHAKKPAKRQKVNRPRPTPPAPKNIQFLPAPEGMPLEGAAAADVANGVVYYTPAMDQFARAHETAHVFDWQLLNDGDRRYFTRLMHAPNKGDYWGRTEDGRPSGDPRGTAAEWFADYYAAMATNYHPRPNQFLDSYASIGKKRLVRFERALQRLARRRGLTQFYSGS